MLLLNTLLPDVQAVGTPVLGVLQSRRILPYSQDAIQSAHAVNNGGMVMIRGRHMAI